VGERFRLIVDGRGTFASGACAPPRRTLDDAVSPSTIRLKRASTIAEIRTRISQPSLALLQACADRYLLGLTGDATLAALLVKPLQHN
jgi:hypothetical protein